MAGTIGTPEFSGDKKFTPPPPEHPDYLKELVKTAIASSTVRRELERKTLPALREMHASVQGEISHRMQLLEDAAEYQMGLSQLKEFEQEGFLTDKSVICLVEEALKKIDEELHPKNNAADISEPSETHNTTTEHNEGHLIIPFEENRHAKEDPEALHKDTLDRLEAIVDNVDMDTFSQLLNQGRNHPLAPDQAVQRLNGMFTRLYWRIFDGKANEQEKALWDKISTFSPSPLLLDTRNSFHREIERYIRRGPRTEGNEEAASNIAKPSRRAKETRTEKKPVDPSVLIQQVLERVTGRGAKLNMNQRFNPLQVKEVFGAHRKKDELAVEKDVVRPQKREGNDYHASYTLVEAIQMAVIPRYTGATKDQLEDLPVLIELELEKWAKDHPDVISAK